MQIISRNQIGIYFERETITLICKSISRFEALTRLVCQFFHPPAKMDQASQYQKAAFDRIRPRGSLNSREISPRFSNLEPFRGPQMSKLKFNMLGKCQAGPLQVQEMFSTDSARNVFQPSMAKQRVSIAYLRAPALPQIGAQLTQTWKLITKKIQSSTYKTKKDQLKWFTTLIEVCVCVCA